MAKLLLSSFLCVVVAAACSSGSGGSSSLTGGTQITGTVGGKAFAFQSGAATVDKNGGIGIILSDAVALCDSITQRKIDPGETIVQAYGLIGTAPGTFKAEHGDVKYASVKSTCTTGSAVDGQVDRTGRVKTSDFTISNVTSSVVDGKLDVTFDDGSTVSGTFSVPVCSASDAENPTCY